MTFLAEYSHDLIVGMGSIIATGVAGYLAVGRKVSYMSGQLEMLLKIGAKVDKQGETLAVHETRIDRCALDLGQAHGKIRALEKSLAPSSLHPKPKV